MALSPELSISITADRAVLSLVDETVYGSPNPARSALRVFLTLYKVNTDNVGTSITVTSNTGDAETVTSWSGDFGNDGWYKALFVAIPAYAGGTTYAIYDAVYDTVTDLVYRSKSAGNVGNLLSDTIYWEPISDPTTLAENEGETNESVNITSLVYSRILTYHSQFAYGNLIAGNCECSDCDDENIIQPYEIYSLLLNGAIIADQRSEFIKGERIARKLQGIEVSDCSC